jgi:hypothetical protein
LLRSDQWIPEGQNQQSDDLCEDAWQRVILQ